jgi:integrase
MPTIRERTKVTGERVFHVQVRMIGFPTRTASFPTRRLAERWAKTIEAEMIEGKHFRNVEARRRTLGEAIDRYLAEEMPRKRDGSMSRANLPYWKKAIGHLKLAAVTPSVIVEHRGKLLRKPYRRANPTAERTSLKEGEVPREFLRTPATVNRYLAALSHVFTVARKEWHWISYNPLDGVTKLPESRGRVRSLSDQERKRLLKETSKDATLHVFVVVALSTAARAGELLKLRWSDVDLKDGRVLFRITKNAQPRAVWLHGEAQRLMNEHATTKSEDDDRVFRNSKGKGDYHYSKCFKAACDAAKLSDFKFHDLRHTAATYLARAGATEQQLRAIGGWKSGVVSRYVHLAAEEAKDVLERMNKELFGEEEDSDENAAGRNPPVAR